MIKFIVDNDRSSRGISCFHENFPEIIGDGMDRPTSLLDLYSQLRKKLDADLIKEFKEAIKNPKKGCV